MRLPISLPKEITFFFTYAFPYTVLSQAKESENLLLSSYLEPYMLGYNTGHLEVGYLDGFSYGDPNRLTEDVFIRQYISATNPEDAFTIENIANRLLDGFYAVVFADEYYLPHRKAYRRNHFVHEFLLYGIDDGCVNTLALCENGLLGFPSFSQVDLINAIQQGRNYFSLRGDCPWIKEQYLIYLKPRRELLSCRMDIATIKQKLDAYFHGTGSVSETERVLSSKEIQEKTQLRGTPQIAYGVCLTQVMKTHLQKQREFLQENQNIVYGSNYQRVHMFAEQYAVALRRARAIAEHINTEKERKYLERAVRAVETIRMNYLRCYIMDESTDTKKRLVKHMIDTLSGI